MKADIRLRAFHDPPVSTICVVLINGQDQTLIFVVPEPYSVRTVYFTQFNPANVQPAKNGRAVVSIVLYPGHPNAVPGEFLLEMWFESYGGAIEAIRKIHEIAGVVEPHEVPNVVPGVNAPWRYNSGERAVGRLHGGNAPAIGGAVGSTAQGTEKQKDSGPLASNSGSPPREAPREAAPEEAAKAPEVPKKPIDVIDLCDSDDESPADIASAKRTSSDSIIDIERLSPEAVVQVGPGAARDAAKRARADRNKRRRRQKKTRFQDWVDGGSSSSTSPEASP